MKKLISLFLLTAILMTNISGANSSNAKIDPYAEESIIDTLLLSQEEYVNNHMMKTDSKKNKIQATVESFLKVSKAKVRDFEKYDETVFCSKNINENLNYRLKLTQYYNELYTATNRIVWDDITFRDFEVIINNDEAVAKVIEDYRYFLDDEFNKTYYRIKEYTITLKLNNDRWLIESVKTNDPWELDEDFVYSDFDVNARVESSLKTVNSSTPEEKIKEKMVAILDASVMSSSMYLWNYDYSLVQDYAEKYFNSINPVFGAASQDCQNFASQCVWAGFGGNGSDTKIPPAVDRVYGGSDPRVWERNNYYTGAPYGSGWTWDNVNAFAYMAHTGGFQIEGVNGYVDFGSLDYASIGDVIAWEDDGVTPAFGNLDHAMVVTAVTGTFGSRNKDNIYIAAHNSYSNYAYEPLTSYSPYLESSHTTTRIIQAYYNVQQP